MNEIINSSENLNVSGDLGFNLQLLDNAFNGKVDSILTKTKKDNYGTLEQKIRDSYQLVNHNGTAFRNARITVEYLDARLEELKWGTIGSELKAQAQEEQRRLRKYHLAR